jgi:hypothetical protein
VLAFHRPADSAEFGRRVIVEAAVGFDFAAKKTQERRKVVVQKWGR